MNDLNIICKNVNRKSLNDVWNSHGVEKTVEKNKPSGPFPSAGFFEQHVKNRVAE
jgi:hypothetical protein